MVHFLLIQLRKQGRKNEYERHKLEALNQRQKRVNSCLLPSTNNVNFLLHEKSKLLFD